MTTLERADAWKRERDDTFRRATADAFSKRATLRLVQRALVLVGREKALRQKLRKAEVRTLWVLEDTGLTWTVELCRGDILFHRGRAAEPDLTFTWRSAAAFFQQVMDGPHDFDDFQCTGNHRLLKYSVLTYAAVCRHLQALVSEFEASREGVESEPQTRR